MIVILILLLLALFLFGGTRFSTAGFDGYNLLVALLSIILIVWLIQLLFGSTSV